MSESQSGVDRAGDECYWCGGDLADGGSIQIQMREGEPERETCPDCVRDWPPEEVRDEYIDDGTETRQSSDGGADT